ncbi:MAG TPA: amino acid racemase [Spirochaetota bacterium]|nr:amino acid racemase [Spirochaetota bacterium]
MKTPGIIGGIGPESTIDYYRSIISLCREKYDPDGYPEIIIASVNMTRMLAIIEAADMAGLLGYLLDAASRLRAAGADFGAIASNTPHVVFAELRERTPLPLISIVEATTARAASSGIKHAALLGTGFTMRNDFYRTAFEREGIHLHVPSSDEQAYVHQRIFDELEFGIVKTETLAGFDAIINRMRRDHGVEGVVLGCTELPLLYADPTGPGGLPFFNTARIHIEKIVDAMKR